MCAQIVEIGDFRLKRERHRLLDGCQHKQLTLDDEGEFVTCDDCKTQVGNYAALRMLVERWALLQDRVDSQRAAISEAAGKTVELRAAQRLEKAWRSRSMVPACPHCHEAIFPTDGLGGSMVNKEMAARRRAVGKQEAASAAAP
jgi:hypothetical protein